MAIKVGDTVRVINDQGGQPFHIGELCTVVQVDNDSVPYNITSQERSTDNYWIQAHRVELVEAVNKSPSIGMSAVRVSDLVDSISYSSNPRITGRWSNIEIDMQSYVNNKPKKSIMQTLTNWIKKNLNADAQTLYKAGFINSALELTSDGKDALWSIMYDKYMAELVANALDRINAEKEDK